MQHNIINGNTWYSLLCYGVLVQDIKPASSWQAGFIIKATETERERERDRQTDRDRDRERQRQREKYRERDRDRETERQRQRQREYEDDLAQCLHEKRNQSTHFVSAYSAE